MSPATPAADSRWPMFVFNEPTSTGRSLARPGPSAAPIARISIGSPEQNDRVIEALREVV